VHLLDQFSVDFLFRNVLEVKCLQLEHTGNGTNAITEELLNFLTDDTVNVEFFFVHNQFELGRSVHFIEKVLNGLVLNFPTVYTEHLRTKHVSVFLRQCEDRHGAHVDDQLVSIIFRQMLEGLNSTTKTDLVATSFSGDIFDRFFLDKTIHFIKIKCARMLAVDISFSKTHSGLL